MDRMGFQGLYKRKSSSLDFKLGKARQVTSSTSGTCPEGAARVGCSRRLLG